MEVQVNDKELQAKLKGKVVVITGGNNGIGKACVDYYAAAGAHIVWGDLRNTTTSTEADKLTFVKCDVTNWDEQLELFETAYTKYGRIDTVIANAGVGELFSLFKDDVDASSGKLLPPNLKVLDVNTTGAVYTTKLAFHYFKKQEPQGGDLVLIGSMASYQGETGLWTYAIAKHGLLGMMRSTYKWTPSFNSRINLVGPYMTRTGLMNDKLEEAFKGFPIQEPIAIARAAAVFSAETKYNGHGVVVGNDRIFELEDKLRELQPQWMGEYMTNLKGTGDALVPWTAWLID